MRVQCFFWKESYLTTSTSNSFTILLKAWVDGGIWCCKFIKFLSLKTSFGEIQKLRFTKSYFLSIPLNIGKLYRYLSQKLMSHFKSLQDFLMDNIFGKRIRISNVYSFSRFVSVSFNWRQIFGDPKFAVWC